MRIFKTKLFDKWANAVNLKNSNIILAADEIKSGLVDARLGRNIFKKRIAAPTGGKRGGFRTILAYKEGNKIFFLYGFEKNQRSSISAKDIKALKALAKVYLCFSDKDIKKALIKGELIEVTDE